MIPYRGDRFEHFNNVPPMLRHTIPPPQYQQSIVQPPSLMYTTQVPNPHQPFVGNMSRHPHPQQQQPIMFVHQRPQLQQPWIIASAPSPPMPPFAQTHSTTFHPVQPSLPPPQPSFSGGTNVPQSSFSGTINTSQPLLGPGTGITQPPFSGGTAVLKRKSHYLDEPDFDSPINSTNENRSELPSLMSIPMQPFVNHHNQQQHFPTQNTRYKDNNSTKLRPSGPQTLPPPRPPHGPCLSSPSDLFHSQLPHSHWNSSDRNIYPVTSQVTPTTILEQQQQQQILTSQLFQKHQFIPIDTILKEPGRLQRPSQIIVFLRGLPGSGKSYVADLIKNEEESQSKGTNKPKIFSIDNYFQTENQHEVKDPKTGRITRTTVMEYEYDRKMEETYRRSLIKSVRKAIDDRFYPFLIVDQNNEQLEHFRDMADYAEANQFQVYFIELQNDVNTCSQRNIHNRSISEIQQIQKCWEQLPLRYEILDIRSLLQSDAIDEVEMDDAPLTTTSENNEDEKEDEEEEEEDSQITKKSKWETMMETNPDRLDGVYQRRLSASNRSSSPLETRLNNTSISVEEQPDNASSDGQSKKKKVRWADIEENALHLHKKAIGFVIGQTEQDWQRMSDDYDPSQKLNQYRYI